MTPIVVAPDPVLRRPTKPVTAVDQRLLRIIDDLVEALKNATDPQGVGLAAPQIGVSLRLFAIRPAFKAPVRVFINPDILSASQRLQSPTAKNGVYEGCLSLPHFYSPLKRSMSVTIKYQTLKSPPSPSLVKEGVAGKPEEILIDKTETFTGFTAHIIQHEIDHLNGILFVDHVLAQNSKLFHIEGKTWEEIQL